MPAKCLRTTRSSKGAGAGRSRRYQRGRRHRQTLGLKLGDALSFDIGGQIKVAKITSLRKVDWGSMRVNFFAMYPVAQLTDVPVSFISAFRAPDRVAAVAGQPAPRSFDNELVRAFPNITNVDMSSTIAQVQRVLDQVIRAVEFLFGFTLAAGLVVLFAAITATREERAKEFAIMRAVGARASLLRQVQRAELAGVGLLAGFLASVVALAVRLGPGQICLRFQLDRFLDRAAARQPGRRRAGAGGGLVGFALGAHDPRGRNPSQSPVTMQIEEKPPGTPPLPRPLNG